MNFTCKVHFTSITKEYKVYKFSMNVIALVARNFMENLLLHNQRNKFSTNVVALVKGIAFGLCLKARRQ